MLYIYFLMMFGIYMKFTIFQQKIWASSVKYYWSYWLGKMCLFKCTTLLLFEKSFAVNVWTSQKKYFCPIFFSLWGKLNSKKLLSIRYEILGLLDNTLSGNYKYSPSNRQILPLPIQMKLSQNQYTFWDIFFAFLVSTWNF